MQKLASVLLVDDDATTNYLHQRLLYQLGVTDHVLVAENGEQALTLLAQACLSPDPATCPALVLLDLNMPVMNGVDFLAAYQPAPPTPPLVIVLLTTALAPRDQAQLHALPVADILEKPLPKRSWLRCCTGISGAGRPPTSPVASRRGTRRREPTTDRGCLERQTKALSGSVGARIFSVVSTSSPAARWNARYQQLPPLAPLTPADTSLRLVAETGLAHDAPILDVGCGTSAFLAGLLDQRYGNLLATDISMTALQRHRQQLGAGRADRILWLEDDVLDPRQLQVLEPILLWHDQGLLPEFTHVRQQAAYRHLLDHMLLPGGWLLLAVPATDATSLASSSAYSTDQLAALLGDDYQLHRQVQASYARLAEPAQLYTYALFQRGLHPHGGFRPAHVRNV
ncbi:MAG: response regulator [Janthinobacterium lividum]